MTNIKRAMKHSKAIADYEAKGNSLTIADLIKILLEVPNPENTLVILETNNTWQDVSSVYPLLVNYREGIALCSSGKSIPYPSEAIQKALEGGEL